jgi:hypothetical protein
VRPTELFFYLLVKINKTNIILQNAITKEADIGLRPILVNFKHSIMPFFIDLRVGPISGLLCYCDKNITYAIN